MSIYNPWRLSRAPAGGLAAIDGEKPCTGMPDLCRRHSIMSLYEKAWQDVGSRIAGAAHAAGRDPAAIRLLAVSKSFPRRGDPRGLLARPARVRRELRAGGAGQDGRARRPAGHRVASDRAAAEQQDAPRRRRTSPGCRRSTGSKIAERLVAARDAGPAAAQRLRAGQHQRRGEQERRARPDDALALARDVAAPAAAAAARLHGHRRADRRRRAAARAVPPAARVSRRGSRRRDWRSTRCRWACRRISKRRSPKARRWCGSARRSSALARARSKTGREA